VSNLVSLAFKVAEIETFIHVLMLIKKTYLNALLGYLLQSFSQKQFTICFSFHFPFYRI